MSNIHILTFINLIRGTKPHPTFEIGDTSIGITTEIFTQGNCGNFAQALQVAFGGQVVYSNHHLMCHVDGRLYDITGDVTEDYPTFVHASLTQLEDMTNNYSFDDRGPML